MLCCAAGPDVQAMATMAAEAASQAVAATYLYGAADPAAHLAMQAAAQAAAQAVYGKAWAAQAAQAGPWGFAPPPPPPPLPPPPPPAYPPPPPSRFAAPGFGAAPSYPQQQRPFPEQRGRSPQLPDPFACQQRQQEVRGRAQLGGVCALFAGWLWG